MSPHTYEECVHIHKIVNGKFLVIETKKITTERKRLGYSASSNLKFVVKYWDNKKYYDELIMDAECVIWALTPKSVIYNRIWSNKLTFLSSERIFKKCFFLKLLDYRLWAQLICNFLAYKKKTYLLCDGSFVASDFSKIGFCNSKTLKHGYFPSTREYDVQDLLLKKTEKGINILWVGRLVYWKRPLEFLRAVNKLLLTGPKSIIHIDIIGSGSSKIEKKIQLYIKKNKLYDLVKFHGLKDNDFVVQKMLDASIFVTSSSKEEGWGAVVNEAMNSCCAVVASNAIGCVDYLLQHKENCLTYKSGKVVDLFDKMLYLTRNQTEITRLGKNAYNTITQVWNGKESATRFVKTIEDIQLEKKWSYSDGPFSLGQEIKKNHEVNFITFIV